MEASLDAGALTVIRLLKDLEPFPQMRMVDDRRDDLRNRTNFAELAH
jgi:hypothetical protein